MQKGVSPVMSYVLIVALVITVAMSAYFWANYEIDRMENIPIAHNVEAQFIAADSAIQSVAHGDINFTTYMTLYYPKGVVMLEANNDWLKYVGQINAQVYSKEAEETSVNATCCTDCNVIRDNATTIVMTKIPYTRVYRGAQGTYNQYVEIVACYTDIDLVAASGCLGKSGPVSKLILRKTGYNNTKPVVEVKVC